MAVSVQSHDDVLESIAAEIDISVHQFEELKGRYESIGSWLDREGSKIANFEPEITPQGSVRIGTLIRPMNEGDVYDVDLICLLHGSKSEITQKMLKELVGHELTLYAMRNSMSMPSERSRCWKLEYGEGTKFCADILPALPDASSVRAELVKSGHAQVASDSELVNQAIAITDRDHIKYDQISEDWLTSNPIGFSEWFRRRMIVQLRRQKEIFAASNMIKASVDDVPDYKVKTPLQKVIQILKRHRDFVFENDTDGKPSSIIITTLAARAYNHEETMVDALRAILEGMDAHIENREGVYWIPNPINPEENFAEKWVDNHQKCKNFFDWLEQVQQDFATYIRASRFDIIPENLSKRLGKGLIERIMAPRDHESVRAGAMMGIIGSQRDTRLESAVDVIKNEGLDAKPWVRKTVI